MSATILDVSSDSQLTGAAARIEQRYGRDTRLWLSRIGGNSWSRDHRLTLEQLARDVYAGLGSLDQREHDEALVIARALARLQDAEPVTSYAEDAARYCVGALANGQRCNQPNGRSDAGLFREVFLCHRHRGQARDSSPHGDAELRAAALRFFDAWTGSSSRVYFLGDGKYLKIGTSLQVHARTSQLVKEARTGATGTIRPDDVDAGKLTVYGSVPGDAHLESRLHFYLRPRWVCGEWFIDDKTSRSALRAHGFDLDAEGLVVGGGLDDDPDCRETYRPWSVMDRERARMVQPLSPPEPEPELELAGEKLLTLREAQEYLFRKSSGFGSLLLRAVDDELLPAVGHGRAARFREVDLNAWLDLELEEQRAARKGAS